MNTERKCPWGEDIYCTYDWDAYDCVIADPESREIGKRNTHDIERFNLRMRMVLARLQRRTIKFSKSWERLEYSVNLFINRYNPQLSSFLNQDDYKSLHLNIMQLL